MEYREKTDEVKPKKYRDEYVLGFESIIANREKDGLKQRNELITKIFEQPEIMRQNLKDMLGWPLNSKIDFKCQVESELLYEGEKYNIFRMRFEILKDLKLTGLLFKIKSDEPKPLVIAQHGGSGTPEIISGIYGYSANYNDLTERILKYGVHIFAPQLLLWNVEEYGTEYDRKAIDARLKRVGSSITAVEIFGIKRVLDYFENQNYVKNFGMIGLSYGGFYTMFTSACDTRIKLAITCSQFNDREKYAWPDWTWNNSAFTFSDAEIACLVYPRHLCIQVGENDELFDCKYAKTEYNRLLKLCENVGTDWLDFMTFDGTHEFCKDDEPIRKLIDSLNTTS